MGNTIPTESIPPTWGHFSPLLRLPIIFFPLSFPHKDVIVSRPTSSFNLIQLTIHLPVSFLLFTPFSLCSSWLSSVLTRNSLTSAGKPILMPSSAFHDSNPPLGIHPLPAPLVPLEMTWYEHSFSCLAPCGGAQPAAVLPRLISLRGSWVTDLSFFFSQFHWQATIMGPVSCSRLEDLGGHLALCEVQRLMIRLTILIDHIG